MPHICTRCSNVFDFGEDILKGCPNCGWKKFMFTKKKPLDEKAQLQQREQIITRAMGVRIPPRRKEEESMAIAPAATCDGKPEGKALESIKITAPGTYELNLPSLFERDELIMAVKEGTYFIDLTSAFKKGKKD
jgi:predicted  nucleic acid-binding Zn-ribbon protein